MELLCSASGGVLMLKGELEDGDLVVCVISCSFLPACVNFCGAVCVLFH